MSTSTSPPLDFNCRSPMKMSMTWTSNCWILMTKSCVKWEYKQTGKRKNRLNDEDTAAPRPRAVRQRPGLEESSAPENNSSRQEEDEETEGFW
uniref:Uncharacterized protein n=1 Tax=Peronospora matthiolae TaxID=2874970 RepID=A0AAV1UEH7_9STRA